MKPARLCLFALLAVFRCLPCVAQSPVLLASVRTWGDLRAQPPVNLPALPADATASAYRLGINLAAATLYGGVVVYCLAKGAEPAARSGELGFFQVEVQLADTTEESVIIVLALSISGGVGEQFTEVSKESGGYFLTFGVLTRQH